MYRLLAIVGNYVFEYGCVGDYEGRREKVVGWDRNGGSCIVGLILVITKERISRRGGGFVDDCGV